MATRKEEEQKMYDQETNPSRMKMCAGSRSRWCCSSGQRIADIIRDGNIRPLQKKYLRYLDIDSQDVGTHSLLLKENLCWVRGLHRGYQENGDTPKDMETCHSRKIVPLITYSSYTRGVGIQKRFLFPTSINLTMLDQ
ncbi:hypothetical protein OIU74_011236 [Salix koriyanagi]|uniref:Uncharacterized protein n=1 Tax=Salix koriyanagi TaxID=2511006 RepID=A0A9Q0TES5_9ROSI|nr:hypothetical protein OIU74_011236 [Salix koriyanagi]